MKHFFTALIVCMCVCLTALGAQAIEIRTLTFEDAGTSNTWASLIDSPQYGGSLLYGDIVYSWVDSGNTGLGSEIPENWGTRKYSGGGHAISNYWNGNLAEGTYENQLSVYTPDNTGSGVNGAGHNGSNNFCVHYGYHDNSGYSAENLPYFYFDNNGEHVIDHMWINNTTYFVNCITNGNSLTAELGPNDYVLVKAIGYGSDGTPTDSTTKILAKGTFFINSWTEWDLTDLGSVNRVKFNIEGTSDNGYGFSQPAYFAYDDVAVQFESADSNISNQVVRKAAPNYDGEIKTLTVSLRDSYLGGDVPEGVSYTYSTENNSGITGRLSKDESDCLTLIGMPSNAKIIGIDGEMHNSDTTSKGETLVYMGDTQFASVRFCGEDVDDWGFKEDLFAIDERVHVEFELTDTPYCTDNIVFKNYSYVNKIRIYKYDIYYVLDDTTTSGIADVEVADGAGDGAWYTLQGIRVALPTAKGIYIHNGKKVAVR